jgi:hypothetical protein
MRSKFWRYSKVTLIARKQYALDGGVASSSLSARSTAPAIHVICDSNGDTDRQEKVGQGSHGAEWDPRPLHNCALVLLSAQVCGARPRSFDAGAECSSSRRWRRRWRRRRSGGGGGAECKGCSSGSTAGARSSARCCITRQQQNKQHHAIPLRRPCVCGVCVCTQGNSPCNIVCGSSLPGCDSP